MESKAHKTAIVLVNIGTPYKPEVKYVRRYLSRFLNDRRVIDLPWLGQKLLVNFLIVPFRAPKSTKLYQRLWTKNGSPLLYYGHELAEHLSEKLGDNYDAFLAMRYSKPYMHEVLEHIRKEGYGQILLFPLFPQYASSTSGSIFQAAFRHMQNWYVFPNVRTISQFYRHPAFIRAFAEKGRQYRPETYDHIVFSYHGLPKRQVDKVHPGIDSDSCSCASETPPHGHFCYKNAAYETTRLLREALQIPEAKTTVAFQSRLSDKWLQPFTDEVIKQLAIEGHKRVLVFSPAFVADCLETLVEINYENAELFRAHGGEKLQLVESLNAGEHWVDALKEIVLEH